MTKVLHRFSMENAKSVDTTLSTNNKLSERERPKTKKEKAEMSTVPYESVVGRLIYVMVYTRLDIGYVVRVVSRYMSIWLQ